MDNFESCNYDNKPEDTDTIQYIWTELKNNPNIYCWIPIKKKKANIKDIDIRDVNIEELPHSDYISHVENVSEKVNLALQKDFLRKLQRGEDIVSADDPRKFEIAKQFIKDEKLILYGGTAVNYHLPKSKKFYSKDDIADYDVFSPTPWQDAIKIAKILKNQDYAYVEVRAGIHLGTYKVYANLWPVIDITYMVQEYFDRLKYKVIDGIRVISKEHALKNLYNELIRVSNVSRWPKIAHRLRLLDSTLKSKLKCKNLFQGGSIVIPEPFLSLLSSTISFIRKKNLLITGLQAFNLYMALADKKERILVTYYDVLTENALKDIKLLYDQLVKINKNLIITTRYFLSKNFNVLRYSINYIENNEYYYPVCHITQLDQCTPFRKILNTNIVSIDYLKFSIYTRLIFHDVDRYECKEYKCMIQLLNSAQKEYYKKHGTNEFNNSPFQRFISTCIGPKKHDIKHRILEKTLAKKSKLECAKNSKINCSAPCEWHKDKSECFLPPKVYFVK